MLIEGIIRFRFSPLPPILLIHKNPVNPVPKTTHPLSPAPHWTFLIRY